MSTKIMIYFKTICGHRTKTTYKSWFCALPFWGSFPVDSGCDIYAENDSNFGVPENVTRVVLRT